MTSPVGGKPESTQDRYDDVHSVGSSFGAELDENAVRNLLGNQVENPFTSIVTGLAGTVVGILESVANGILGIFKPGATEGGIRDAIVAVMEPIESQVYDLGKRLNAMSTEVMGKIEEQKGLIDDATAAVNEAKDAVAAVKAVADQNKKDVAAAVSKAEKASADLAALVPQITAAIDAANKASSDVSTLTPKVTAASADAAKASQDVAALSPKVTDAVSKSDKATKDVAALTPKVTAASNKATQAASDVADLTPKVTAAQDKADKAASDLSTLTPKVTAAQRRADAAYTEAGKVRTELSPKITAAQNQADAAVADLAELEPKVTAAQSKADSAFTEAGKVRNEVTPKIEAAQSKGQEALSVADKAVDWLRNPKEIGASLIAIDPETDKPNWAEHLDPVTAEENPLNLPNAYKTGDNSSKNPREMWVNIDPSTDYVVSMWVKANKPGSQMTYDVRNQDGAHALQGAREIPGFPSAGDTWRPYWIKDVPTEWTQYKKIATPRETSRLFRFAVSYFKHSSGETQDVVQYIADLQIYPLVPSQLDVDQAQNDAIKANQDILRQQEEINAAQATANLAQKNFNDNQQKWNTASSNATKALQDSAALQALLNDAQADINAHQKIFNDNQTKWNAASTNATKALADAAKAQKDINAEQAKFNTFQTDFNKKQTTWNKASSDATKALQDVAKAQEDINAEQQKFNNFQTDFNKKQTAWNNAVDRSIATQKTVNDNFEKWTDGANTAIQANTSAIKALGKIDTGESLIAYLTPTDAEVRAGTAKYDVPVWTTGAHREFSGQNPPPENVKYAYGASSTDITKSPKTVKVAVRPGTKYILSFWAYGSGDLVIYMYGNGGGYPIRSTRQLKVNQETLQIEKDSGGKRIYDSAKNGNSSSSTGTQWLLNGFAPDELYKWVHYKFEVEFTEPTTEVWFDRFYWNWRKTSVYGQYLAGMQFYPDVPTQADVDEAQNKAIEANTAFAKQQIELNTLFQEQLWAQLDMIEQLELQSPRVYHQNVDDGKLISNIPSWVGWSTAREYKNTFINFYHRYSDTKMVAWQATGKWEGQVRVTMTWSNGATDVWVYTVYKDRIVRGDSSWTGRTFFNSGGAALIYHKNTTFEVYPKHLGRWFNLFWMPEDKRWYHSTTELDLRGVEGGPSLLRWDTSNAKENPRIRLTTSFKCNQPLTLEDMTGKKVTYPAGKIINPQIIDVNKLDKSKQYRFEEAGVHW